MVAIACGRAPADVEPDPGPGVEPVAPTPPLLVSHAAAQHTCVLDSDGVATCWGRNDDGQLGGGNTSATLTRVAIARRIDMIAVGGRHGCALDEDGLALCWGANDRGQIGNGTTVGRATPTAVATERRFRRIAAGAAHSCALDADGHAFCWGGNRWGQLGDGTRSNASSPVAVRTGAVFARLAAGSRHTCGVTGDGVALCWGDNFLGQLGLPRGAQASLDPVPVPGLPDVIAISTGHGHTCAISTESEGWCWGQNGIGQIGSGAPPGSYAPVRVAGVPPLAELRVGYHHTCAVDTAADGWCWGANTASDPGAASITGQLGSDVSWSNLPLRIPFQEPLDVLAPGEAHTCALTRAGVIHCFGSGRHGELGRPDLDRSVAPVRVLEVEPPPAPAQP